MYILTLFPSDALRLHRLSPLLHHGPSALRTPPKIPPFSRLCLANRPFIQNIFLALNILSSKELIDGSHPLAENIFRLALAE